MFAGRKVFADAIFKLGAVGCFILGLGNQGVTQGFRFGKIGKPGALAWNDAISGAPIHPNWALAAHGRTFGARRNRALGHRAGTDMTAIQGQ